MPPAYGHEGPVRDRVKAKEDTRGLAAVNDGGGRGVGREAQWPDSGAGLGM